MSTTKWDEVAEALFDALTGAGSAREVKARLDEYKTAYPNSYASLWRPGASSMVRKMIWAIEEAAELEEERS